MSASAMAEKRSVEEACLDEKGGEEQEEKVTKGKKAKGKKAKTTTSIALPKVFELSSTRRITLSEFKGKFLIDIREYYQDKNDDSTHKPGKKGISLSVEQWEAMKGHMNAIDETIAACQG